jgi:hypothetical protein
MSEEDEKAAVVVLKLSRSMESDFLTEAMGEVEMIMGSSSMLHWSEITVAVFDAQKKPIETAVGLISGSILKLGAGKRQVFSEKLDLALDPWSFAPELSTPHSFFFSVAGLNEGFFYKMTINSWS